ncbi:hypothetical protein [uncultured Roseibium sp.]|uniref:hypothetical protein n=1 Tax=uncultured Roseibium sp. TaxID=1936171 RepID=UPI002615DBC6|nr:hypothetical protein [uncultured Roseibium sp.]
MQRQSSQQAQKFSPGQIKEPNLRASRFLLQKFPAMRQPVAVLLLRIGFIMCNSDKKFDKTINFPDGESAERALKHYNPQRQWVCIEQEGKDECFVPKKATDTGKPIASNAYRKFRQFDDHAVDAMLKTAGIVEARMATLSQQRIQVTLVNSAICAGIFTLCSSDVISPIALKNAYTHFVSLSLTFAFLFGLAFWIIVKSIGATELYYFKLISTSFYCAAKHYRIKTPLTTANAAYRNEMGILKPLLKNHTFRVFAAINFLLPLFTWTIILLLFTQQ